MSKFMLECKGFGKTKAALGRESRKPRMLSLSHPKSSLELENVDKVVLAGIDP